MKKYLFLSILLSFSIGLSAQSLLKEINTTGAGGANGCQPGSVIKVGNFVLFRANNGDVNNLNFELWKTDATTAGTVMSSEINAGGSSFPQGVINVNGVAYFSASNGTGSNGIELWKYNPSSGNPSIVKDIAPGTSDSNPEELTQFGTSGNFYFVAENGSGDKELYKSDGTNGGTVLVSNLNPSGSSNPSSLVYFNNFIYFAADDGVNGTELFRTDGNTITLVKDINPTGSSFPIELTVFNNEIYFAANDGTNGIEIWKTDGTNSGTVLVKNINTTSGASSNPNSFTPVGTKLYFVADDGNIGNELWHTDGTNSGTVSVDINNGVLPSNPTELTGVGSLLFFAATRSVEGNELFYFDPQGNGNESLAGNIEPGSLGSGPQYLTNAYGDLYFSASTSANGREVYRWSNSTNPNIQMLNSINAGAADATPRDFSVLGTELLFFADNGSIGTELYNYTLSNAPTITPISNKTTDENQSITFPVAINSSISTSSNLTLSGSSSDTSLVNPSASTPGFVFGGSGSNRTVTINPVQYAFGQTTLTITVCDISNNCISTSFDLTVNSINNEPILSDVNLSVNEDNTYSYAFGDFNAKVFDPDGTQLDSIRIESLPVNAKLEYNGNELDTSMLPQLIMTSNIGLLNFIPDSNWNGMTSFDYNAYSGGFWSLTSEQINMTVNPVNDVPVIVNQPLKSISEDQTMNFSSSDFGDSTVYFDQEGTALTSIRFTSLPRNGTLFNSGDTVKGSELPLTIGVGLLGNITYNPSSNFFGSDFILYRAGDGTGFSLPDTLQINVVSSNDAPTVTNFTVSTNEDIDYSFTANDFLNNYSDQENDQLDSVLILTLPLNGTLYLAGNAVSSNDTITRSWLDSLTFSPDTNYFGSNTTFQFRASDGKGFSNVGIVTVNVASVNDAPEADAVRRTQDEDNVLAFAEANFSSAYNDQEADAFDGIQVTSLPSNGTLGVSGNTISSSSLPFNISKANLSTFTFTPDLHWNGETYFFWKAYDGNDYSTMADSVIITINPINDAPQVFSFPQSTLEDNAITIFQKDITDNFVDVDEDDAIDHIEIMAKPSNGEILISGIQQTNYPFIVSAALLDTITYVPNQDFNGKDTIVFRGNDGVTYSSNTANILFTVDPVNDAPEFVRFFKEVDEDFIMNFFTSDFEDDSVLVDLEDDGLVNIKVMSVPTNGILRLNNTPIQANNVLSRNQLANITYRGNANFEGTDYFTAQLFDGDLYSSTDTIFLIVNPVNDKPQLTVPGVQSVAEDNPISIKGILISDVDAGLGNIEVSVSASDATMTLASTANLNFTSGDGTADANLVFNGALADVNAAFDSLIYDPNTNFNGFDQVYLTVTDLGNTGSGGAKGDSAVIPIQVDGVNDTTIFTVPGPQTVLEGQNLTISGVSLSDVDQDNLNVSVQISANHGTITLSGTALLTFTEGDGTGDTTMSFFGQLNAVNPALSNMIYKSNDGFFGSEQLSLSVVDTALGSVATDNEIVPVTVNPRAVTFINQPLNQARCEGKNITLSVTPEGTPPFSYQWLKDGQPIQSNDALNQSFTLSGIDTSDVASYSCEVTNPAGTQISSGGSVTVYDTPDVNFGFSEACTGDVVQFSDSTNVIGGDTVQTYVWEMGDGASFGIPNPLHTFNSSNPFNVKLTTTTNRGCIDSIVKVVTVTPKPQVIFSAISECRGDSTNFLNASTVSAGQLSYVWAFGDGDSSTSVNPKHLYQAVGTYNARLIVKNNGKCETSNQQAVTIHPNPNANFNYTDICLTDAADFTNTSTISSGLNSYVWEFGDGAVSNNVSPSRTYQMADTFNVKLMATSNFGCMDSLEQAIIVYPKPSVVFSAPNVCSIDTVQFSNASSVAFGGTSYSWNFGDGNSSILQAPSHFYTSAGSYQPKLVVTGVFGCQDSSSRTVNVYPNPTANFAFSNVCFGTAVDFTNTSSVLNGLNSYNWNFGDGTTSINNAPTKNYANAGNYSVSLSVVSDQQCSDTVFKTVRVYPKPVASFSASSVCFGDTTSFVNNTTLAFGGSTSTWTLGNGTTIIDSAFSTIDYLYPTDGFYLVNLKVEADSGCADSMTQTLQVYPVAQVSTNTTDVSCNGIPTGGININTLGGTPPFLYSINGGSTYQSNSTFNGLSASAYLVTTLDGNGCRADDNANPVVLTQPTPLVVVADSVKNVNCFGDSSGFIIGASSGGVSPYLFSIGNAGFQSNPNFSNLPQGTYTLEARDANNCLASIPVSVNQPSTPIASTFTFSNIPCRGDSSGSIAIQGFGSVGGYEYSVDGGTTYLPDSNFTNLPAGSYTLVVRDTNNCTAIQGLNLTEPSTAIQLSVTSQVNVNCFGDNSGSISVIAVGGTGAKSYSLNPTSGFSTATTFSSLSSGNYTSYAQDFNGCLDSVSVVLSQPSSPLQVDSLAVTDIECFGTPTGQVEIFGVGGTPSYTYYINSGQPQTSNSFTIASGGNYLVTILDSNGCEAVDTAVVNEPAQLVLISSVTNENCEFDSSGSISVNGNGGIAPYQFSLDGNTYTTTSALTGLTNGVYNVYIRDNNGCVEVSQSTVMADSLLPRAGFNAFVVGNTASFNNTSTDGDTYFWNFGDGNTSINTSPTHLYANGAIYSVLLAAENNCGTDTLIRTVDVNSTSIGEISKNAGINVYPNPASNFANISINTSQFGSQVSLRIYSISGKLIHNELLPSNELVNREVSTNNYATGEYLIEISGSKQTLTKKLILGL